MLTMTEPDEIISPENKKNFFTLAPSSAPLILSLITSRSAAHLVPPGVPSAATVVIVTCIAALVVVVVLGIYRIHLTHQQEVKLAETAKEADVTWGDSALTITVNPMEVRG